MPSANFADQRGVSRPQPLGGVPDIVAVERQSGDPTVFPELSLPRLVR